MTATAIHLTYPDEVWSQPCPKCNAPVGMRCLDHRTYDRELYGHRTHAERRKAVQRALSASREDQ